VARSAHELAWPDLVWSHFSRPRFGGFDERVAAAAAAGFAAVGLYAYDYRRMRDEEGRSAAELRSVLEQHDIALAEVETVRGWWATDGAARDECELAESLAYELADAVGVRYLQVIGSYECSIADAIKGFGDICDRAADHGLLVGIEWLPFTNIATADDARRIVEGADRSNGGYCADIWHHVRGANDLEMLRALGGERIFAVQMNDGPPARVVDDYKEDCMIARVPPGDGTFDCVGFVGTLHDMRVTSPISLEICSATLWSAPVEEAAHAAADGMRRVLTAVGEAHG
jgi:sugar phosphate isomerase/epimerase